MLCYPAWDILEQFLIYSRNLSVIFCLRYFYHITLAPIWIEQNCTRLNHIYPKLESLVFRSSYLTLATCHHTKTYFEMLQMTKTPKCRRFKWSTNLAKFRLPFYLYSSYYFFYAIKNRFQIPHAKREFEKENDRRKSFFL